MRIGLVRHYKVDYDQPKFLMTANQFEDWVRHYDEAKIVDMNKQWEDNWELCYSSDLPRAVRTASKLTRCSVKITELLREVPLTAFIKTKRKLPFPVWNMVGRLTWFLPTGSQPESRRETIQRAKKFIRLMEMSGKERVLVVSHWLFLIVLAKELRKAGYSGLKVRRFRNGELYIYEKEQPQ